MSRAWDFVLGCVRWLQFKQQTRTPLRLHGYLYQILRMDTWMGSACRPNPKWEVAANKLEIKKRRGAQLRPPAQGVSMQIQLQPLQLLVLAEARGQGPGLVSACQRKGGFLFSAPRAPKRPPGPGPKPLP